MYEYYKLCDTMGDFEISFFFVIILYYLSTFVRCVRTAFFLIIGCFVKENEFMYIYNGNNFDLLMMMMVVFLMIH